jgi:hypothetical protein
MRALVKRVPTWARLAAVAVAVAAAGAATIAFAVVDGSAGPPTALLPDLVQREPYSLSGATVETDEGTRFRIGFASAVDNLGAGPLLVDGRRDSTDDPQMDAEQVVELSDGSTRTYPGVGKLEYVQSETHQHWHLLDFDRYELRGLDGEPARPDQKTGFCLGDRYDATPGRLPPGKPVAPQLTDECGRNEPDLLTLREGISVGYGDDYDPHLEGQYIDITGLPAGRYELVHHVNADRSLRESDYSNNAASILIEIGWPDGQDARPRIDVVARCGHGKRCAPGDG